MSRTVKETRLKMAKKELDQHKVWLLSAEARLKRALADCEQYEQQITVMEEEISKLEQEVEDGSN